MRFTNFNYQSRYYFSALQNCAFNIQYLDREIFVKLEYFATSRCRISVHRFSTSTFAAVRCLKRQLIIQSAKTYLIVNKSAEYLPDEKNFGYNVRDSRKMIRMNQSFMTDRNLESLFDFPVLFKINRSHLLSRRYHFAITINYIKAISVTINLRTKLHQLDIRFQQIGLYRDSSLKMADTVIQSFQRNSFPEKARC